MHHIPNLKYLSFCLVVTFAQAIKTRYQVENEDVVGAAPTGDAPTTSEWWTILLSTRVHFILEVLRYTLDFTLTGKVWGIYCRYFAENRPCSIRTQPLFISDQPLYPSPVWIKLANCPSLLGLFFQIAHRQPWLGWTSQRTFSEIGQSTQKSANIVIDKLIWEKEYENLARRKKYNYF